MCRQLNPPPCAAALPARSYELPPRFNSHLLQYREDRVQCTYRYYDAANGTLYEDSWGYGGPLLGARAGAFGLVAAWGRRKNTGANASHRWLQACDAVSSGPWKANAP